MNVKLANAIILFLAITWFLFLVFDLIFYIASDSGIRASSDRYKIPGGGYVAYLESIKYKGDQKK